jgi:Tol biopolymer transport system component/predicted Ser/Thr protein kinase
MIEQISHYKILKQIGAGGMGEVYLAEDTRLNRKVALKILPADFASDRKRLHRFIQEARLAANLNHPNICTIYEISEKGETPFIAMEYVEGETLAERNAAANSTDFFETLSIFSQIADALDEAHRNGIIHRDIKSANIIINRRGQVKVLDFGLAKNLTEEISDEAVTKAKTEAGMLIGTVQYMSPEQALGKTLDARTDLWSLGVLLYETACGAMPFRGQTQAGIFDEILNRNPAFPTELNPKLPFEFDALVLKLLEKDRELRYQTASDLRADIKRLRRHLGENSDLMEISKTFSTDQRAMPTAFIASATHGNSAENGFRVTEANAKNGKNWQKYAAPFVLIALFAAVIFAVYQFAGGKKAEYSFADTEISRLTNLGKVFDSVVSGDGKFIVYVADEGTKQSLWLKNISTASNVQIVPAADVIYQGIEVSPDGNWVYYNVWDKKNVGEIFRVPVLGGNSQRIVHDCMPNLSISPDGNRIAFIRSDSKIQRNLLMTASSSGGDEREVTGREFNNGNILTPAWSPDGKTIAFSAFIPEENNRVVSQIIEITPDGKESKVIWSDNEHKFQTGRGLVWLRDKSGLLINLAVTRQYNTQIWQINYADGSARQVTKDFNSYNSLSLSNDGKSLVTTQQDFFLGIWAFPADKPEQAKRLTSGKLEGNGLAWTPDGKIVYSSNVSGTFDIWIMNADGSEKKQITHQAAFNIEPCVSADGRYIFYFSAEDNRVIGITRIGIDGKNPVPLTNQFGNWNVSCSSAENEIFYLSQSEKGQFIMKNSADGNQEKVILRKDASRFAVSPDGKKIAYAFWNSDAQSYGKEIYSLETNKIETFELPDSAVQKVGETPISLRWTADSKNLTFVNDEGGFSNVWLLPPGGEKPKPITNFKEDYVVSFAWSRDGKNLAVARGKALSDAVLFKQTN